VDVWLSRLGLSAAVSVFLEVPRAAGLRGRSLPARWPGARGAEPSGAPRLALAGWVRGGLCSERGPAVPAAWGGAGGSTGAARSEGGESAPEPARPVPGERGDAGLGTGCQLPEPGEPQEGF